MRLLVVSQYFWPEEFRVNDLVDNLVSRGHEVTVLTGLPNYPSGTIFPSYVAAPERFASYAGARVIRVPMLPRSKGSLRLGLNYLSFALSACMFGPLRLKGQRFDAIFAFQASPITSVLPAILLRWLKRAPLLTWILDLWPESLAAVGAVRSPRVLGWVGRLVTFIYRRCDRILIQSRAFLPNLERHGADLSRVRYFPAWTEPLFTQPLATVKPAPEILPYIGNFNILFAGNIGDAQDFPAILDAATRLRDRPDIHWLIVGDGRAADWVREQLPLRGLEGQVHLLGRHPVERMPSFFRGADALLVSLRKESIFAVTIPGKVQSYLAAGLPILGMLDGEGGRVIVEAGAGLVSQAGESQSLAKQACILADMSESERNAMGEKGKAYAEKNFDRASLLFEFEIWLHEVKQKDRMHDFTRLPKTL